MSKKKIFITALMFFLLTVFVGTVFTPLADTINSQKAEKKNLEREREKQAEKVQQLKEQRNGIQEAIKN